jgi:hypothetical protein
MLSRKGKLQGRFPGDGLVLPASFLDLESVTEEGVLV